jgi:hypothetical protein
LFRLFLITLLLCILSNALNAGLGLKDQRLYYNFIILYCFQYNYCPNLISWPRPCFPKPLGPEASEYIKYLKWALIFPIIIKLYLLLIASFKIYLIIKNKDCNINYFLKELSFIYFNKQKLELSLQMVL